MDIRSLVCMLTYGMCFAIRILSLSLGQSLNFVYNFVILYSVEAYTDCCTQLRAFNNLFVLFVKM